MALESKPCCVMCVRLIRVAVQSKTSWTILLYSEGLFVEVHHYSAREFALSAVISQKGAGLRSAALTFAIFVFVQQWSVYAARYRLSSDRHSRWATDPSPSSHHHVLLFCRHCMYAMVDHCVCCFEMLCKRNLPSQYKNHLFGLSSHNAGSFTATAFIVKSAGPGGVSIGNPAAASTRCRRLLLLALPTYRPSFQWLVVVWAARVPL